MPHQRKCYGTDSETPYRVFDDMTELCKIFCPEDLAAGRKHEDDFEEDELEEPEEEPEELEE